MFSQIDKKILSRHGEWNQKQQVLCPEKPNHLHPVILVHGFIGSPFDMKPLGLALAREGYRVIMPVTPGQTWTTPLGDRIGYNRGFYMDWLASVIRKQTQETGMKPYLAGLSMGGTLSTIAAAHGIVDKLALIAPFFKLTGISDKIWKVSNPISSFLPAMSVPRILKGNINNRAGYKRYVPGSWFVSVNAFNHLGNLAFLARQCAAKVSVETKIFLSIKDRVADPKMTLNLFNQMKNIEFHFENRANHILLYDYGADQIINKIVSFFNR